MIFYFFVGLCVSLIELGSTTREIPAYIHICKRNDPLVARCIRDSVEFLKPRLRTGIPEINVPSLEPLHIDIIEVFRPDAQSGLRAYLKNVQVHDASNFQITKLKLNVDKQTYRIGMRFPKMSFDGDYDIDARLLVPIKGSGRFTADIRDVDSQSVLKAKLIEKDGHREIRFTSFDFAIKIGDYEIHLDNLFNGDKTLGKAVIDLIHENKQEVIQAAIPFIERKAAEIMLDSANKITEGLDYDQVFPEK